MIEVMNHIKVLLESTGIPEHSFSQDDDCVFMEILPTGEIMYWVHIPDQSDKAPATRVLKPGNIINTIP